MKNLGFFFVTLFHLVNPLCFAQNTTVAITTHCESRSEGQQECPSNIDVFIADSLVCTIQLSPFQPEYINLGTGSYTFRVSSLGQATLEQDVMINDSLDNVQIHLRPSVRVLGVTTITSINFGPYHKKSTQKAIRKYDQFNKEKWEAQRQEKILLRYKKAMGLGDNVRANANL